MEREKRISDCGKRGVEGAFFFVFRSVIGWRNEVEKPLWGPIGGK